MRKLSRNAPCWCGSGKKYKRCHLNQDAQSKTPQPRMRSGIVIKTDEQIEGIRKSGQLARQILDMLEGRIEAGLTTNDIDRWVYEYTIQHGAYPATLDVEGFHKSVCTSINDVICHGIPDETVLKEGDILNVDVTCILNGYYGDTSRMFVIGEASEEALRLIEVTRECLYLGIEEVKPFNTIGDIGYVIQRYAESHGFSVVRALCGHGTGLDFWEEPQVPHYGQRKSGPILVPNMTFTIEPMINAGGHECKTLSDGWTVVTIDGSLSAQWEHTVRVTETGVEILTD
ncbi:type I methionyl aminopeptidase [Candidatus Poribacteria bacterium]|nr:type I methionyl aminopeptidase [Candidatus Poribacteria bacterium]